MEMTDTKWYLREWQKKQKNKNRKEKVRRGPFKNKNVYLSIFLRIFTIYYFLLFLFLFFVSLGWLSAISSIIIYVKTEHTDEREFSEKILLFFCCVLKRTAGKFIFFGHVFGKWLNLLKF